MALNSRFLAVAGVAASLTSCAHDSVAMSPQSHGPRPLTKNEIAMARPIFGNQIDYRRITVAKTANQRSMTANGRLSMSAQQYSNDYGLEANRYLRKIFMHELTHVWQGQKRIPTSGGWLGLALSGNYDKSYGYNINAVASFGRLNIEQQGNVVMDYFDMAAAVNRGGNGSLCPKIKKYESILKPYLPAIQTPKACR